MATFQGTPLHKADRRQAKETRRRGSSSAQQPRGQRHLTRAPARFNASDPDCGPPPTLRRAGAVFLVIGCDALRAVDPGEVQYPYSLLLTHPPRPARGLLPSEEGSEPGQGVSSAGVSDLRPQEGTLR
jgi:hypothetical protein